MPKIQGLWPLPMLQRSPHSLVVHTLKWYVLQVTWSTPAGTSPTSLMPRSHDHYLHLLGWSTLSSGMYYGLTPRSHDHIIILLTLAPELWAWSACSPPCEVSPPAVGSLSVLLFDHFRSNSTLMSDWAESWERGGEGRMGSREWKGGRRVNGLRSDGVHKFSLNRGLGIRKY